MSSLELVSYLLWAVGGYLLLRLISFILVIRNLYGMDAQRVAYERVDPAAVPEYVRPLLIAGGHELEALGFVAIECVTFENIFNIDRIRRWGVFCRHPERNTGALVHVSSLPEPGWPVAYSFVTRFSNGEVLRTVNGLQWSMIGSHPHTTLVDPYALSLREQWEAHLFELARLTPSCEALACSGEELLRLENQWLDEYVDGLIGSRTLIASEEPGKLRLTFVASVREAWRLLRQLPRFRKFQKARAQRPPATPIVQLPPEAEVEAYSAATARPRTLTLQNKVLLFLVTLLISVITLPLIGLPSAWWGVMLMAVLIFHELGHWAAMKAFGYRDTTIFFLPLFGAATVGRNNDATPTQRVLMYLMGPAPGILLGVLLLYWLGVHPELRTHRWYQSGIELGSLLAIINGLNLLPMLPLDGGHIVNLLFFGRHPWVEAGFRLVTILALVVGAVRLHVPVLILLAVFLAIGLRVLFIRAKVAQMLRRERAAGTVEERSLLLRAFQWFRENGYGSLSYSRRAVLIRLALQEPPTFPSRWMAGGLLSLYLGVLAIGPVAYGQFRARARAVHVPITHRSLRGVGRDEATIIHLRDGSQPPASVVPPAPADGR